MSAEDTGSRAKPVNHNTVRLTFLSIPENESIGRTLAAAYAAVSDPTLEELMDFKTAVSEAVTNAILHAYPESEGDIEMELSRDESRVKVVVTDFGIGIRDIEKSMEPLYTTDTSGERSGMGFTFMEAFSDHLEVISEPGRGTRVYLTKRMGGR
ncbi:MAG: anti-sigma F factor [Eubacterium sp.]|nr:anti-sigma F factor [Eubacterium sp.]